MLAWLHASDVNGTIFGGKITAIFLGINKEQEFIQFVNLSETLPRDGEKALDAAMGAAITMELPRQHQAMRSLGYFVGKEK